MLRVISVVSGKGGVGKSTVSANVARSLARLGKRVLLIELDFGLRSLDIILSAENNVVYDLGDVLGGSMSIESAAAECGEGMFLLSAPAVRTDFEVDFKSLVSKASGRFDYVVFDCPAGIGEMVVKCCESADAILLVTLAEPICVRDAARIAGVIGNSEKMRLIINRVAKKPERKNIFSDLDEVIDAVGVRLCGVVPEDQAVKASSLNGKQLENTALAFKAFDNIARRLCGDYVPLAIK